MRIRRLKNHDRPTPPRLPRKPNLKRSPTPPSLRIEKQIADVVSKNNNSSNEQKPQPPKLRKRWYKPDQIKDFLTSLSESYRNRVKLEVLGRSHGGRDICMAIIRQSMGRPASCGVFVECGSNGCDWVAIASGMFIISTLATCPSAILRNTDYYVIPCSNPDAYADSFVPNSTLVDLTHNYPIQLGHKDVRKIPEADFQNAIMKWRQSYQFIRTECVALMRGLLSNAKNIKIFVSIQEGAKTPKLLYPYGFCVECVENEGFVKKVASAGSNASKGLHFHEGSIYAACGVDFGNIIDFLQLSGKVKYNFIMHVHDRQKAPMKQMICTVGADVLHALKSMADQVNIIGDTDSKKPKTSGGSSSKYC